MSDVTYIVLTIAFFVIALLIAYATDRL